MLSNFKKYSGIITLTKCLLIFKQKNYHLGSLYCLDRSVSRRLLAIGSNDKIINNQLLWGGGENNEDNDMLELPMNDHGHNGNMSA